MNLDSFFSSLPSPCVLSPSSSREPWAHWARGFPLSYKSSPNFKVWDSVSLYGPGRFQSCDLRGSASQAAGINCGQATPGLLLPWSPFSSTGGWGLFLCQATANTRDDRIVDIWGFRIQKSSLDLIFSLLTLKVCFLNSIIDLSIYHLSIYLSIVYQLSIY